MAELKEELAKRGQSTQGLKDVLLERLKEALAKHLPALTGADQSARTNDDLKGFAATARWKPLVPQEVAVPEPQNIVTTRHGLFQDKMNQFFHKNTTLWKCLIMSPLLQKKKYHGFIEMVDPC